MIRPGDKLSVSLCVFRAPLGETTNMLKRFGYNQWFIATIKGSRWFS
jgi:hypothetical protein